jgi:hypothetical protein
MQNAEDEGQKAGTALAGSERDRRKVPAFAKKLYQKGVWNSKITVPDTFLIQFLKCFPSSEPFRNTRGNPAMTAKSRRQQLQEMLADEPNDPFLHYGVAMEFVSEGDDEGAIRSFQELLRIAPDYVPGYLQAGQALVRMGRIDEAGGVFRSGIAQARQQGNYHAADEMQGFLANLG